MLSEPKVAITLSNTSPVKVVRHDISDSVQTKSNSGVVRVVQSASTVANKAADDSLDKTFLNVDDDDESFHNAASLFFLNSNKFDDDATCRFSTNFVTPPLRREQILTTIPSQAQDFQSTVIKRKTTRSHMGKLKQQQDSSHSFHAAVQSLDDVTSITTVESHSTGSLTELATLMESVVSNELGQLSVTDANKQEKQMKNKKQKKG